MSLTLRLLRATWSFGIILADYLTHIWLAKLVRRRVLDPETGRRRIRYPAWLKARRKRLDERNAERALRAMLGLRGVYIKLGQVLSIMGAFLPRPFIKRFETLQDQVPPRSYREVEQVFRQDLGKLPTECFTRIEQEPIAAASLGQVHVAYLEDGTKVAVKILYPGIRGVIAVDMRVVRWALHVYSWFVPVQGLENVYSSLVDLLHRETDYIHEADCMERMAANFASDDDILFPEVVRALTTSDILTMTFMEGVKITNMKALEEMGVDRTQLATRLVQSFYKQLFLDHFFHADPHPGNFLVQADEEGNPRLVVLDFGAISEAHDYLIEGLMDVVQGIFSNDANKLLTGFDRMGFVAQDGDRAMLEKLVRTYFSRLLKFKDRSVAGFMKQDPKDLAKLADPGMEVDELRGLMKSVKYPDTWFYVERASVLMFWLCATIAPGLDTMQAGMPYIMPLMMKRNQEAAAELAARKQAEQEQGGQIQTAQGSAAAVASVPPAEPGEEGHTVDVPDTSSTSPA